MACTALALSVLHAAAQLESGSAAASLEREGQNLPPNRSACDFQRITATRSNDAVQAEWGMPVQPAGSVYHIEQSADGRTWALCHVLSMGSGPLRSEEPTTLRLQPLPESAFIRIKHLVGRQAQCASEAVAILNAEPARIVPAEPAELLVHARP